MAVFNGLIEAVIAKPMAEPDKFGNTFRISIKDAQGVWYSWGTGKRDNISIKEGKDWVNVEGGDEVFFKYDVNGDFKNISKSSMSIIKKGAGQPQRQSAPAQSGASKTAQSGGYKKDTSGISVGHAINGAMFLLKDKPKNMDDLTDTANNIHDITEKLKNELAKVNPSMSEYDRGAMVGHAVLNACKLSKKVEEVEAKANELMTVVVPSVTSHVKGETSSAAPAASQAPDFDNFDDDVPF